MLEVETEKGPATLTKFEQIEASKNTAELTAVLEAVKRLKQECNLMIYTDSEYVAAGFEQGWIENWEEQGWTTAKGKEVVNKELWIELKARIGLEVIFQVKENHSYRAWLETQVKGGTGNV